MKYVEEYRDSQLVQKLKSEIEKIISKPCSIMEICGGQTHSIMKYNLEKFLPKEISLIHGPGCPVCVTPINKINKAISIAGQKDVILATFGDMMRVPGSDKDLLSAKADGSDIRMIYSPLDALKIAEQNPNKIVVFFAVGFETTAPANASSIIEAKKRNLKNYFVLVSQVRVPPAIEILLSDQSAKLDGFLAAGHVCTVMGYEEYEYLIEKYKCPIVVTGFEPVDILEGLYMVTKQLEEKRYEIENQYSRVVSRNGNIFAKNTIKSVFDVIDMTWRGIGIIPNSGLGIKKEYADYDAEQFFDLGEIDNSENDECIAGLILQGKRKPNECPAYGKECKPEKPLGAPMVSSEGACAAYYRYGQIE